MAWQREEEGSLAWPLKEVRASSHLPRRPMAPYLVAWEGWPSPPLHSDQASREAHYLPLGKVGWKEEASASGEGWGPCPSLVSVTVAVRVPPSHTVMTLASRGPGDIVTL